MATPLKSSQGALFIQERPTEVPEYLGCVDLDAITAPEGDETMIYCRNASGTIETIGSSKGVPGNVTTSIKALRFVDTDVLDRIKNCYINLFAGVTSCGKVNVFGNMERVLVLHHARVTSRAWENVVMREADEATIRTLDISAWNPVREARPVAVVRQTIAETRDLRDIVFCNEAQCASDCGEQKDAGQDGFVTSEGTAGSPTSDADVWSTTDSGATWANATGLVPSPFTGGDIMSAVCFDMDATTKRLLVASGQKAGSAQVAYSDDDGSTWTTVTVGSTAWEGAIHSDALFALDRSHIWLATSHGRIYFSDDAGVTWTSNASALTASAANGLNAVKFVDSQNGYAVGNNDTLIKTEDNSTWTALTAPSSSDNMTALEVFKDNKNKILVGSNADGLWVSMDGGDSFTSLSFTGQGTTGTVQSIAFANESIGFMIHNTSAPLGSVHRSIDGGISWNKLTTPTNAGLNALAVIDDNTAYAVGNAYSGTGFVCKVSG